jgi:hypothetical protein
MPRFHFHTDEMADPQGIELAGLAEAKCEATKLASRVICDVADEFWDEAQGCLTVTDASGLTLFQLQIIGTESPSIRAASQRA